MPRDKKRKLPYQVDKFSAHTFHYYQPPNVENNTFSYSSNLPFPGCTSNEDDSIPTKTETNTSFKKKSLASSFSIGNTSELSNQIEKSIEKIEIKNKKQNMLKFDKEKLNVDIKDLNTNRVTMNNSFSNFQSLKNKLNLFLNKKNKFDGESIQENSTTDDDNEDSSNEETSDDELLSLIDHKINFDIFNDSSNLDYNLSFLSSPLSTTTTTTTTTINNSDIATTTTSTFTNSDSLNSNYELQFFFNGDSYDKELNEIKEAINNKDIL